MTLKVLLGRLVLGVSLMFAASPAMAEGALVAKHPEPQAWSSDGVFGKFDRQQLQRGYQVYKEVCAACHAMHLLSFRNLSQPGGPEFSVAQVKALAASFKYPALDDKGEPIERTGTPADRFPSPFPNDVAARAANNNALPPDLSVMTKARHGGANYVYNLIIGYSDAPAGFSLLPGLNYNEYFEGHQLAMPAPLVSDGQVTWPEGNPPATKQQMAKDVTAFLIWAAEPKMEERKELGVQVMIFLTLLAVLLFFAYKRVWRDVEH
ncbi:MAG: cytochrome c1 [Alphaproteobacteria bacterium]|nr:cytochrome c1 [Alphaproteobacteria bacterium]